MSIKSDDYLENLKSQEKILLFEAKDDIYEDCAELLDYPFIEVDLSISTELKEVVMKYFDIKKLPTIIFKGISISDNFQKEIQKIKMEEINTWVCNFVDPSKVTLFIKGSPENPKCGFTRTLIEILKDEGVTEDGIKYFDILNDENVRSGLKMLNGWPTYPQVYLEGEFIGGLDLVKKLKENGKLKEKLSYVINK